MNQLAQFFFISFVFLKQFYLFPSGSIGIADIFLVLSGGAAFFSRICRDRRKLLYKEDSAWYVFIAFVLLINGANYILSGNAEFLKYSLYWFYCTLAIWTFRALVSETFLLSVSHICEVNLLFQLLLFVTGHGRYFYETWGGARFMGTFNDPNQFAFFVFTMLLFLFLYYSSHPKKSFWLFFAAACYLIYQSKSTGIFTGLFTFIMVLSWNWFWKQYKKSGRRCVWNIGIFILMIGLGLFFYRILPGENFDISQTDYNLLTRIQQKIWKLSNGNFADLLYDRSAERLVLNSEYLLYGAGEGNFARFLPTEEFISKITPGVFDVVRVNEIHSSFFNIWFSYGLLPMLFLVYWIIKNIRYCNCWQAAAVLGILVESFTLMNCRQPFFWFVIVFCGAYKRKKFQG